ncbi:MAG: hypothetical protein HN726_01590 [Candidatus Magasanikbacteria bacterium]|jgi:hypothetical protein|nr:hypothetical protein [Candidatus Magasanikbacteria bacterium]MBT4221528.1 hypothetical protein [Candidatus Magasanikbacteria bacterium]MBT4350479.1 hypothetical protein [Candidatus Magasanikbacteria bacterium]MBT4541871.1 hypothetical protein [Candidatus Magasanikbacteria bacterium]MBT6253109.1 hypothetical protein [Candidatus Magasanikbacteria bacterium]
MKSKKAKKAKKGRPSTQAHLPIAEIRDGMVVLKDGTVRGVLLVSSINFALKSEDEQNAIISSYVGFLNSIDFPLQIVVQSRQLQIKPYLEQLIQLERNQANELLRVQIADYRAFVQELVDIGQIMTKKFYVVVPYDPLSNKKKGFFSRFKEVLKPSFTIRLKEKRFEQRRHDLEVRTRHVAGGLESLGLQVAELDTQALIELYYGTYNPDVALTQQLQNVEKIQVEDIY